MGFTLLSFVTNIHSFFLYLYSHLARNPFICDCNLKWLADYLHKNPIETSGAKCDAPKRMQKKQLGAMRDIKCKYLFVL